MDIHKTPALALTLRGYAQTAPSLWRPHLAAAADAVEECARLRAERDALLQWQADANRVMAEMRDASLIIRERDEARALLQEARDAWQDGYFSGWTPAFVDRIDAALKGAK